MIRLIQRRLIIPRGDTGTFTVPVIATKNTGDVAVFSIIDNMTAKKVFEKIVQVSGDTMTIEFSHNETVNLPVGKYVWDIKFYQNPEFADGALINGVEVDSYYAAFTMPICEIRQTGDNLLMADDAPGTELSASQLDILNATVNETNAAKNTAVESASTASAAASTATENAATAVASAEEATAALNELKEILPSLAEVATSGSYEDLEDKPFIPSRVSDLTDDSGHYTKPANGIPASDLEETYLTEHQDISGKANIADLAAVATSGDYDDLLNKPTIPEVPVQDVQVNGASIIQNGIANVPIASSDDLGVIKINSNTFALINGKLQLAYYNTDKYKTGNSSVIPIVTSHQHEATFYGLAKAAGDTTQSQSDNAVGTYTDSAKTAIQTMLDVPSNAAMTTAIGNAIGNINSFDMAVVQELPTQDISTHTIYLVPKTGETNDVYDEYIYINNNWEMVGNTQVDLSNYVQQPAVDDINNTINDMEYINKIYARDIIGSSNLMTNKTWKYNTKFNNDGTIASSAVGWMVSNEYIETSGNSYKVIYDNSEPGYIVQVACYKNEEFQRFYMNALTNTGFQTFNIDTTNYDKIKFGTRKNNPVIYMFRNDSTIVDALAGKANIEDIPNVPVQDVQVNGVSVLDNGTADVDLSNYVQKTDYATANNAGVVKIMSNSGGGIDIVNQYLRIAGATDAYVKSGSSAYRPLTPSIQHTSTFYGLAKAAGDTTQSQSDNAVGIYTDEAKAAIQTMLDVPNKAALDTKAPVIYKTVTGSSLTITDAIPNLPLKSLTLTITGDPTDVGTTSASVVVSPSTIAAEGTTYTKSFDAIYEGTLDFISGKLTITKAILDLGSIGYNYNNDYHYFSSQALYGIIDTNEPIYSSDLTVVTPEEIQAGTEGVAFGGATYIYVYNNNYVGMTTAEFKAAVAGKCIAYSLRTPRVVQLSAEDIRALSGTTYISSEDGNLNVEYLVDTKSYIDAGIAVVPGTGVGSAKTRDFEYNGTVFSNESSGKGSFAEGSSNIASGNFAHVEGAQNTVSGGAAHAEGQRNSALGVRSHVEGYNNRAGAIASHAEGAGTWTAGNASHAEGSDTSALGMYSHAEGSYTAAFNQLAHAEGGSTSAYGIGSHAEGIGYYNVITISGDANVKEYSYVEDVELLDNDRVVYINDSMYISATITSVDIANKKITLSKSLVDQLDNKLIRVYRGGAIGYCSHTEGLSTTAFADNQHVQGKYNVVDNQEIYADIVGNGTAFNARSNAYALDWDGNGHYAGDVYVHANADSTGGTKLATIEDVGVQDVQVNGTSVVSNGVANVPIGNGLYSNNGALDVNPANSTQIKQGIVTNRPIAPYTQDASTFYGLAKAAGSDEKGSTLPVGQYTDNAKSAIRTMLGAASDNIIAISDTAPTDPDTKIWIPETATSVQVPTVSEMETALAGKVGDVQVNGTSIVSGGIATVPITGPNVLGVMKPGVGMSVSTQTGEVAVSTATNDVIKTGTDRYYYVDARRAYAAAFFGLAKAAGADMKDIANTTVGVYPAAQQTAIKAMLGVEEGLKVVRLI